MRSPIAWATKTCVNCASKDICFLLNVEETLLPRVSKGVLRSENSTCSESKADLFRGFIWISFRQHVRQPRTPGFGNQTWRNISTIAAPKINTAWHVETFRLGGTDPLWRGVHHPCLNWQCTDKSTCTTRGEVSLPKCSYIAAKHC